MTATLVADPDSAIADVGFLTSRLGSEDSGYVQSRFTTPAHLADIGLSLNSNAGLSRVPSRPSKGRSPGSNGGFEGVNWVEEGVMEGESITLSLRWAFALTGHPFANAMSPALSPCRCPILCLLQATRTLSRSGRQLRELVQVEGGL